MLIKLYLQFTPVLGCSGKTINSISWYFHVQGSLLDGAFKPISKSALPRNAERCADRLRR